MATLERLSVRGFKSIRVLDEFELRDVNVLIGANGAGKRYLWTCCGCCRSLPTAGVRSSSGRRTWSDLPATTRFVTVRRLPGASGWTAFAVSVRISLEWVAWLESLPALG